VLGDGSSAATIRQVIVGPAEGLTDPVHRGPNLDLLVGWHQGQGY
jgi:hypothetical protein